MLPAGPGGCPSWWPDHPQASPCPTPTHGDCGAQFVPCCPGIVGYYSLGSSLTQATAPHPAMRARELLILCGALGLSASIGLVMMSSDTLALEAPPRPVAEAPTAPTVSTESPRELAPHDGQVEPIAVDLRAESPRVDTAGWTKGVVKGDIQIAVSILDQIQSISVIVEELRQPIGPDNSFRHPHRLVVPVQRGVGTPTFEVTGIEFSEYPYTVRLYSPGLNGSSRTITIDQKTPLYDDLVLQITPGAPFSVLLRDQDQNPYPKVDLRLVPVGEPAGRATQQGITDLFGSVVFESVLAGDYDLVTALGGVPLEAPQRITVQPGGRLFGSKVQGQSHTSIVPRGMPLEIFVSTTAGYRVADARVHLQASDRIKLTQFDVTTDYNGRVEIPRLTPGIWQIDVFKDDHQRTTKQITIKENEPPTPLQFTLTRLR